MNMKVTVFLIPLMAASLCAVGADVKRFADAEEAMRYYDGAAPCEDAQGAQLTKSEISRFFFEARERVLKGVKKGYSNSDYKAIQRFFDVTLPEWNKKQPVLLYPCYADKAWVGDKEAWIVAFDWEIPGMKHGDGTVELSHIVVFVVDPGSGDIISSASCG